MSKGELKKVETVDITKWGVVLCCECERALGFFPPDNNSIDEDTELELYCEACACGEQQKGGNS